MASIRLEAVDVDIDRTPVLERVTTEVPDGAFGAVIGPSGCGKSTLLRLVAGLNRSSRGRVWFGDVDVTTTEPGRRDIGMVFQSPALFSNRNVRRNVSFPLELRKETVEAIRERVDAETRAMQIEHLLLRNPDELSRGEQQLVQIARTMVRAPRVLLLDEPFAPLDAHLRRRMRAELRLLQEGYGVTTLMATNDPDDVEALASHVVVLGAMPDRSGAVHTVVQSGPPAAVAADPVSLEVATAVSPLWMIDAVVESGDGGFWLRVDEGRVLRAWAPALGGHLGDTVIVGFRPGDLVASPAGALAATVDRIVPGSPEPLLCRIGGRILYASTGDRDIGHFGVGDSIHLDVRSQFVFERAGGRRIA